MSTLTNLNKSLRALLAMTACLFGMTLANAQSWTGHTVSDIISATDENETQVYLYNVGTGYFVNQGGYWGTQPNLRTVGLPFTISQGTDLVYIWTGIDNSSTALGAIGYVQTNHTADTDTFSSGRMYMDRTPGNTNYNGSCGMEFSEVESSDATIYNISCIVKVDSASYATTYTDTDGDGYVHLYWEAVERDGNIWIEVVEEISEAENGQWIIVTLQDLLDAFEQTDASFAQPADATFLLDDQNFHRNNTDRDQWTCTSGSSTGSWTYNVTASSAGTFYNGMGYANGNVSYNNTSLNAQIPYGGYWAAHIFPTSADTYTVSQDVDITRAGWYEISCAGFYVESSTDTSGEMTALLSASSDGTATSNTSASASLYYDTSASTITPGSGHDSETCLAGCQLITNSSTEETYKTIVYVYVGNTDNTGTNTECNLTLTISVQVANGNGGWVAFDDVQLAYLGNSTQYIVLDETDTALSYDSSEETTAADDEQVEGSSIGLNDQLTNAIAYGKSQNEASPASGMTNYTLILARPFVDGEWNSLVLPVDLTYNQLVGAFGSNYRLAKFTSVTIGSATAQVINFTSIPASQGLEAGVLYIIKPTKSNLYSLDEDTQTASFTTPLPSNSTAIQDYQKDVKQEYYLIPQVSFPEDIIEEKAYEEEVINPGIEAMATDGTLYFHGTYIYQESRVPTGSYVVGKSNGVYGFYHYTGTNSLNIKGFRTWIDTKAGEEEEEESTDEETSTSVLYFTIDGSVDGTLNDNVPSAIERILNDNGSSVSATGSAKTDNRVYSLSGQLVREGNSLDGLAKGVYLLNGQKYIVK